uniref:purine-nucleoside phosphorylase n=1 Tax=Phlebotomus papatasi TaxID=29031 RepID=A0A1B0DM50_PHLPP
MKGIRVQENHFSRYPYDLIKEIADHLLERTEYRPKIGIICGSGLGTLAESLTDVDIFDYENIPYFPSTTVEGHAGRMVFGKLRGVPVMCMQGRFHYYEGHSLEKCSMPIRVMKLSGVSHLIITNAAGGLNPIYNVGDIVVIKDHLNLMGMAGLNPLLGPNDPRFGPRFPAMNHAYNPELRLIAKRIAKEMGIEKEVHEGVYT